MVYILFVTLNYYQNAVTFTHEYTKKLDCETALHNFKLEMGTNKVYGFCQEVSIRK